MADLGGQTTTLVGASGRRRGELALQKVSRQLAGLARRIIAEQSDARCRAYVHLLVALAERLEPPQPVGVQGMARAAQLLNDGTGPVYDRSRAGELGPTLKRAVRELDLTE